MFELTNEFIQEFLIWYKNDHHSQNEDAYAEEINKAYLARLSRVKFIDFFYQFARAGGLLQSGGHRKADQLKENIQQNFKEFQNYVLKPFEKDFDLESWLDNRFSFWGKGTATIYLNRLDKKKYTIINNKSLQAYRFLGYDVGSNKLSVCYDKLKSAQQNVMVKFPQIENFYIADALSHYLVAIRGKEIGFIETNYYTVGAVWNEREDQTERFFQNNIWENGYDDRFVDIVNSVKVGDMLALKSSFARGRDSMLRVKSIGMVINNPQDGKTLYVQWEQPFEWYDLKGYGGYRKTIEQVTPLEHIKTIFYYETPLEKRKQNYKFALNQILYGAPGTGKTYNTINKALEIVGFDSNDVVGRNDITKIFDDYRKIGQIAFITFHQNYTYEDFMIGLAPDEKNGILSFYKKEGIFYKLAKEAKNNWLASKNNYTLEVDFDTVFESFFAKLIEEEIKGIDIPMVNTSFKVTKITDTKKIEFTKNSGGTGHDLLISNVQGLYDGTTSYSISGLGVYYHPLVAALKKHAETLKTQRLPQEPLKNYVLIIDEINRANISRVFGELITLLEDDKRLGEENALEVILPNGEKFGVPPNLYLVGTMNTADKSITLVDIALRRRFEFVAYNPIYEEDHGKGYKAEEVRLLKYINKKIYERKKSTDYLIGHAYFMKNMPIEEVLRKKVIPLLMEYFQNKIEIVTDIFKESGYDVKFSEESYSWTINGK